MHHSNTISIQSSESDRLCFFTHGVRKSFSENRIFELSEMARRGKAGRGEAGWGGGKQGEARRSKATRGDARRRRRGTTARRGAAERGEAGWRSGEAGRAGAAGMVCIIFVIVSLSPTEDHCISFLHISPN